jgi:hypothetical protein
MILTTMTIDGNFVHRRSEQMGAVAILESAQSVARTIARRVRSARRADTHVSASLPLLVAPIATRARFNQPGADLSVNRHSHTGPTLAELEFPELPDAPSAEGKLVAALLAGSISRDRYRRAMHVLAAREERAHPDFPPPPVTC